jgi:hypothetical protein
VRPVDQELLDLPDVPLRQPPVVAAEQAQVGDALGFDAAGEIDV